MTEPTIKEHWLPRFSINRPVTVSMIMLAIMVVGLIAYHRIQLDLIPFGSNFPYMAVWVPYRDANPQEVQELVVKPLEQELKTVKDLRRMYSESFAAGCWFWLEFSQGTNMDIAYAQLSDRVERARPFLPDEVEYIYMRRFRDSDTPVLYMAVSYDESVVDPYYATDRFIKRSIEGVRGVANVEVYGLREKNVQIIVDSDKVRTYRVNLLQLMRALLNDNFAISNGYVYKGKTKYLLRTTSRFTSLEDIRKIQIGGGVRLENIAEVVFDYEEEQNNIQRVNGVISAGIEIFKESSANTVDVCSRIKEKLEEQFGSRVELKGVKYFPFWDQGKMIATSIGDVKTSMLWGGFFSFLVLLYFLRKWRITLMLTLAIPLSLLLAIIGMYALGWTLNAFTMMGLMISIGMVVDNSIVITENIYRFNGLGYEPRRASLMGASEVGLAIIMATLTTVVVFVPLMVMTGESMISFYLTRIGVPVVLAISGSLLIALVLIPLASLKTIPAKVNIIQTSHSWSAQRYQNALVKVLKHRLDSLIVITLVIISMMIPWKGMKKSDQAQGGPRDAQVIFNFPSNYNVDKVDKTLSYVADIITKKKEEYQIEHITTRANKLWGLISIYLEKDKDTQWYEFLFRKMAKWLGISNYQRMTRANLTEAILKDLPEIPGVRMTTSFHDDSAGSQSTINFLIQGYDIGVLEEIARELEKQIKLVDGVFSVETDTETGLDEIHIEAHRERSFQVGSNPDYLGQLVRFTLGHRKISNYQTPEKEIGIFVKTRSDQRQSVARLKNMFIKTDGGAETNLSALSNLTYHRSIGNIRRENGKSSLEIKIYTEDQDLEKMTARLEGIFKNFRYPTGYSYSKGQRSRIFDEQMADIFTAGLFSIVLVFLIMGILFESWVLPLSVLVAIPAAFVGSFWLLYITGTTFDSMAGIGLVVLIGVVVNNAIVLIDLVNQYRRDGMQREQAIIVAGIHRLRPILMTALTTIFGLLPMAVGNTGLIGIPYAPMGITLIGGLISSTFLTLFAVPVLYTYFDDMRYFFPEMAKGFFRFSTRLQK